MESLELTVDEMKAELLRARRLAVIAEDAGEEDAANQHRSMERALVTALDRAGVRNA